MLTCYYCAKTIKSDAKHTGVVDVARKTGWNPIKQRVFDLDFPKAYHQSCYDKAEAEAARLLSIA